MSQFFRIDRRLWKVVCNLGSDEALAYLTIACGADANMMTGWSAKAIRKYTGISRYKTESALETLKSYGPVEQTKGGTKPRYRLIMPEEYLGDKDDGDDWIYLPSALVTGTASAKEIFTPIERLYQAKNPGAIRLAIELYASHTLAEDGGIPKELIRRTYTRERIGQCGPTVVWGFSSLGISVAPFAPFVTSFLTGKFDKGQKRDAGWDEFFKSWEIVSDLGLVEIIAHVIETDSVDGIVVHPLPTGYQGEDFERALADVARRAAEALMSEEQVRWARSKFMTLLPTWEHQHPNVALMGIARMRFRPHTKMTAAWLAKNAEWFDEEGKKWRSSYAKMAELGRPIQSDARLAS
jgi:hypothetical protein